MGIYASRPSRMVGQVLADLFVLGWGVVWGLIGVFISSTIAVLATPARRDGPDGGAAGRRLH